MKIIDFARKGNVIRFYLGEDSLETWYGDDWNDYPYECNAGPVYERFVAETQDIVLPFDWLVLEPSDTYRHFEFSKDDMRQRITPCLLIIPPDLVDYSEDFQHYLGMDRVMKVYFGDNIQKFTNLIC